MGTGRTCSAAVHACMCVLCNGKGGSSAGLEQVMHSRHATLMHCARVHCVPHDLSGCSSSRTLSQTAWSAASRTTSFKKAGFRHAAVMDSGSCSQVHHTRVGDASGRANNIPHSFRHLSHFTHQVRCSPYTVHAHIMLVRVAISSSSHQQRSRNQANPSHRALSSRHNCCQHQTDASHSSAHLADGDQAAHSAELRLLAPPPRLLARVLGGGSSGCSCTRV